MKARLVSEQEHGPSGKMLPIGHIIDHPDAFRLVQMGIAEPADDECAAKAGMTPEQIAQAQIAQHRTALGIHPDDFDAYAAGWMVGYKRTSEKPVVDVLGNTSNIWQPGPKFGQYEDLLREAMEADVDESDDHPGEHCDDPASPSGAPAASP